MSEAISPIESLDALVSNLTMAARHLTSAGERSRFEARRYLRMAQGALPDVTLSETVGPVTWREARMSLTGTLNHAAEIAAWCASQGVAPDESQLCALSLNVALIIEWTQQAQPEGEAA